MKKHLLSLAEKIAIGLLSIAAFPLSASATDEITATETSTVSLPAAVSLTDGSFTAWNNAKTYASAWTSSKFSELTLKCSGNNMENASDTIALYSTSSSKDYTLAVSGDYKIKALTIGLKNRYSDESGAVAKVNGESKTLTYEEQTYTFSNLSTTSVTINLAKGTVHSGQSGNWALITKCQVTLEKTTLGKAFDLTVSNGSGVSTSGYASTWKSTTTDPQIVLHAPANNMQAVGDSLGLWSGSSKSSVYTVSAGSKYSIAGYLLTFRNKVAGTTDITITTNGTTYTATDTAQTIFVDGQTAPYMGFTEAGSNNGLVFTKFTIFLTPRIAGSGTDLFVTDYSSAHPYRIPAIAKTKKGTIVAASDYRPCGSDIGFGHVNIVCKTSSDNGSTWSDEIAVLTGNGTSGSDSCGFGDAAIVADSESDTILIMCAAGNTSYPSSTVDKHILVARTYSTDEGKTWAKPEFVTDKIYSIFDNSTNGKIKALFFGSGRICQSKTVKVGTHYRLYAALCARDNGNRVIYSDDFGKTWNALGGIDALPAPSGDEPKCEELPDGTVILSSRMGGGRYFNLFTYTNVEKGEGTWGTVAASNSSNKGAYTGGNSCNGEILILPALRKSDSKEVYVALQSVPTGSSRSNVSIYYKELSELADLEDPATFAANWDGKLEVSTIGSAYSTMIMQGNDSIAFLYEEDTYGYDYTIVYKQLSLEGITGGAYSYKADVNRQTFVTKILTERVNAIKALTGGTALGMLSTADAETVHSAMESVVAVYTATPTAQGYADAVAKISEGVAGHLNTPQEGVQYTFLNKAREGYYLTTNGSTYNGQTTQTTDGTQYFHFVKADEDKWYLYNDAAKTFVANSPATSSAFSQTTTYNNIGVYTLTSDTDGWSQLSCTSPTHSTHKGIHLDASHNVVAWNPATDGSTWKIVPVDADAETTCTKALQSVIDEAKSVACTKLGEYGDNSGSIAAAENKLTATSQTEIEAAIPTLITAIGNFTLNMPKVGSFLRIKAASEWTSTQPYLLCDTTLASGKSIEVAKFGASTSKDPKSIFYYAVKDSKNTLLAYNTGYYATTVTNGTAFLTFNGVSGTPTSISFKEAGNGVKGHYNVVFNDNRIVYTGSTDGSNYTWANAAGSSATGNGYNYELEEVDTLPVTIGTAGYATLFTPVRLAIPENVKAYTGTKQNNYLQLSLLTGYIPANTPVVLEASADTYYFPIDAEETAAESDDDAASGLSGTLGTITAPTGALTLQLPEGSEIGFYTFSGSEILGFKAYLSADQATGASGLTFNYNTTAISNAQLTPANTEQSIYDLQGRRLSKAGKGIYIIDGKKVIRL